jgi:hypothetical protein
MGKPYAPCRSLAGAHILQTIFATISRDERLYQVARWGAGRALEFKMRALWLLVELISLDMLASLRLRT